MLTESNQHRSVSFLHTYRVFFIGGLRIPNADDLVQLGACSYHTKPFNVPQLMMEIAHAIESREKLNRSKSLSAGISLDISRKRFKVPRISISRLIRLGVQPTTDILVQDI